MCNMTGAFKLDGFGALTAVPAMAFDCMTTDALIACHEHLYEDAEFANLPNAAISVWPASVHDGAAKAYWVVDWTGPDIRTAGQCEIEDGNVTGNMRF